MPSPEPTPPRPLPEVVLREWTEADFAPFAEMNSDPEVMRYFPRTLTETESRASFDRLRAAISQRGWGLWAVESDGRFAGLTGLWEPSFSAPFMPCVEIGWRLRREFWGCGVAFAAARKSVAYARDRLRLPELVSFTSVHNLPSRALMERLGFARDREGDFDHPSIEAGSPLRHHVLYRLPLRAGD